MPKKITIGENWDHGMWVHISALFMDPNAKFPSSTEADDKVDEKKAFEIRKPMFAIRIYLFRGTP